MKIQAKSGGSTDKKIALQADTQWFHLFRSMIENGDLAKMSGSSLKVYLVIKSYCNFNTGASFPNLETIALKAGFSMSQVKRCIKELQDLGYINMQKMGRNNQYVLREKLAIRDLFGDNVAEASWDYIPTMVSNTLDELKHYINTRLPVNGQIIQIENLLININNVSGDGNVINNSPVDLDKFNPEMQELMKKFAQKGRLKITPIIDIDAENSDEKDD
jgi:hypothetical protein